MHFLWSETKVPQTVCQLVSVAILGRSLEQLVDRVTLLGAVFLNTTAKVIVESSPATLIHTFAQQRIDRATLQNSLATRCTRTPQSVFCAATFRPCDPAKVAGDR